MCCSFIKTYFEFNRSMTARVSANRNVLIVLANNSKERSMSTSSINKKLKIERKQNIPVVKGMPLVGTTFSIMASGGGRKLHEYINKRHQQYGPVFREKLGSVDAVWICNPSDMKLLFAQEGKYPRHVLPEAWLLYNDIYGQQRGLYFMYLSYYLPLYLLFNQ